MAKDEKKKKQEDSAMSMLSQHQDAKQGRRGAVSESVGMSTPGLECKESYGLHCRVVSEVIVNSPEELADRRIDASCRNSSSKEIVAGGWTARDNLAAQRVDNLFQSEIKNIRLPSMGIAQNRRILRKDSDLGRITGLS